MKHYRVGDLVNIDAKVVMLADAEAEIEKARQEGIDTAWGKNGLDGIREKARADERERMVNTVSHWWTAKGWDPSCFTMLTDFIRSRGKPQESKPLERLPTIVHSLGQEHEACVVDKINSLIDAFNDLQEWLRK
jgi:hypothetical protein